MAHRLLKIQKERDGSVILMQCIQCIKLGKFAARPRTVRTSQMGGHALFYTLNIIANSRAQHQEKVNTVAILIK